MRAHGCIAFGMALALRGMRALRRGWIGAGRGSCATGRDVWVLPWMLHWPRAVGATALAAGRVREVLAAGRTGHSDCVASCLRFASSELRWPRAARVAAPERGPRALRAGRGPHGAFGSCDRVLAMSLRSSAGRGPRTWGAGPGPHWASALLCWALGAYCAGRGPYGGPLWPW